MHDEIDALAIKHTPYLDDIYSRTIPFFDGGITCAVAHTPEGISTFIINDISSASAIQLFINTDGEGNSHVSFEHDGWSNVPSANDIINLERQIELLEDYDNWDSEYRESTMYQKAHIKNFAFDITRKTGLAIRSVESGIESLLSSSATVTPSIPEELVFEIKNMHEDIEKLAFLEDKHPHYRDLEFGHKKKKRFT